MSYLVMCTFDLKNATSQDYQNAYADLADLGLKKVHTSSQGNNVVIPTTAAMGEFSGSDGGVVSNAIRIKVEKAFNARGFRSEIFVIAGNDWGWSATTTP